MKKKYVTSWSALATAIMCVVWVLAMFANMDDLHNLCWIIYGVYQAVKWLIDSFSQKAYERDCVQTAQQKRAYRRVFGRWETIVECSISLLLLIAILLILLPQHTWPICLLLFLTVAWEIGLKWKMLREFEKQKQLEKEHPELANTEEQEEKVHNKTWLILLLCLCLLYSEKF